MVPNSEEIKITKLLSKYKNATATKNDVVNALNNYSSLSYTLENFVFNDGKTKELFKLFGTIPVVYKNNTYYIPICMWLMDTHPNNAPLCYVQPTADMYIKVSMFVDHGGKIYLPYLHEWQPNSSDLLGLIQVMIVTFGDSPPVYSNPKASGTPYPSQSFMPQPGGNTGYMPYPPGNSGGGYPPYPTSNFSNFPPYPPSGMNTNPSNSGTGYFPNMPYPPNPGYNTTFNPSESTNQTGTITEQHIKASLISAVEDKLRRRIQEKVNQCHAEMQTLKRTHQELSEGKAKIDNIIAKLEREEKELQKNISVLEDKNQELEKSLETMEKEEGIDVDEAVITTAPLYKQLINAYAEEAAVEDTMYYLGEALRGGVIDLEVFLKHIRQLSRKQFMLKALMQKCRQKANLAC